MPRVGQATTTSAMPEKLRPYVSLGIDFNYSPGLKQVNAQCPFCDSEDKFSVNSTTGQGRCFNCNFGNDKGGFNIYTFMKQLWEASDAVTNTQVYKEVASHRALEYVDTPAHWGVVRSVVNGEWLLPTYAKAKDGQLTIHHLYRYVGNRVLAMADMNHQLYGLQHYDPNKATIMLCEGPWDAMRLWEVLGCTKLSDEGKFVLTGSKEHSLLNDINVLASPSCSTFSEHWLPWFADKIVYLLYDSDHPKYHPKTNAKQLPAGYAGLRRVAGLLRPVCPEVHYLHWGDEGYDPELPSGTDVRDVLTKKGFGESKHAAFDWLFSRLRPVPKEWHSEIATTKGGDELICRPCANYKQLIGAWKEALRWTSGMDHALAVMLASITSTPSVGDQLWIKVIGPASCGKSTLCEAVSVSQRYVTAKSTIRGFHSGFKVDEAKTDHSLVSIINGKTLVIKDGDTLLQSPNLSQILSEGRDIYDGVSRTHYRNAISREYVGLRMTWILCGTSSLRSIDSSELGERFLDCVIMEGIDEQLENDIGWRAANRAEECLNIESNCEPGSQDSPELVYAKELTGGYVNWLRENSAKIMPTIKLTDDVKRMCMRYGKFVALMRARPSIRQEESVERELSARLVSQHVRLAKCLAVVLNRTEADPAVLSRVRRVALDTARGQTLQIVQLLRKYQTNGLGQQGLATFIHTKKEDRLPTLLRFLKAIGVIEAKLADRQFSAIKWVLTPNMLELYDSVTS